MTVYMLIFLAALLLALWGTPVARWVAPRLGFIDQPDARRVHQRPTPRLGGVAMYLAAIVALLVFRERFGIHQAVGILLGATLVSFFGLWDDRRGLPPALKLLGQFGAAAILLLADVQVGAFTHKWLNIAITLIWAVGVTNAMNLLDNMDGLSGGVGAVAAAFFLLIAAMNGQYLVGALSAALLGACIGFLVYNLNPASIFMGDAGALFLGFMLAAVGIKLRFPENLDIVTWMVPVLILGVPIFDTSLVIISRLRRGLNPLTTPGKDHSSHRLVGMGFTQREAVMILYLVGGALGLLAIFVTQATVLEGYTVGAAVALTALIVLIGLERRYRADQKSLVNKKEIERIR
ncbi:MAG: undecaprenyl-phosphate alpha-N-acetylglucosaminyl 1-phosphate transferase [Anaerolineaceae bacterium 4572_32.1]|nr:MAG: undecaprenyl-phosphate alpha-N-acetylglucosaminyl 1-phosphate transferase [Anaerolineaceae bacterium 4572_32.1]